MIAHSNRKFIRSHVLFVILRYRISIVSLKGETVSCELKKVKNIAYGS